MRKRLPKIFLLDPDDADNAPNRLEGEPYHDKHEPKQRKVKKNSPKGFGRPVKRPGTQSPRRFGGALYLRHGSRPNWISLCDLHYHTRSRWDERAAKSDARPNQLAADGSDPYDISIHGITPESELELMEYRDDIVNALPPMPKISDPNTLGVGGSPLQYRFLVALERLGTIARASQVCGLTLWHVQRVQASVPEFAQAMEHARQLYAASIQEEVHRRAIVGWDEPVYDATGRLAGYKRVYSDGLAALLLKGTNKEFSTKTVKHEGTVNHLPMIDPVKLRQLSEDERRTLRNLLGKLKPDPIGLPATTPQTIDVPSGGGDDGAGN